MLIWTRLLRAGQTMFACAMYAIVGELVTLTHVVLQDKNVLLK